VTPGFASVASAVVDHNGHPVAAVAVTFPTEQVDPDDLEAMAALASAARSTALGITRRLKGR
jgi:DNA-binding IclR family transcriptional regulator